MKNVCPSLYQLASPSPTIPVKFILDWNQFVDHGDVDFLISTLAQRFSSITIILNKNALVSVLIILFSGYNVHKILFLFSSQAVREP